MAKPYFSSKPRSDQEKLVYHNGFPIGHRDFDLEDSFCNRVNQIRAIAGLFFVEMHGEDRFLDDDQCNGISNILNGCADDLGAICAYMLDHQEVNHGDA